MRRSATRRTLRAAALCAATVLWLAPAAGATTATIGNDLSHLMNGSVIGCGVPCTVFQNTQPGAALTSPFAGTIISWSYRSSDVGAVYRLRVLHPVGGGLYQGAGTSAAATVPDANDTAKPPIAVSPALPIGAGDLIGLDVTSSSLAGAPIAATGPSTDQVGYFGTPDLADGATRQPVLPGTGQQLLVQATVQANPPACQALTASTQANQAVAIALSCSGVTAAPLTYALDTTPANGSASLSGATVSYTPNAGFTGSDSFTYHASSADGTATAKTVSITVNASPPPPPLPPPVLAQTVNVAPVAGVVFIKLPPGAVLSALPPTRWATAALGSLVKGSGFVQLTEARQIPVGSILDTTGGIVQLSSASSTKNQLNVGSFASGIFKALQGRKSRGLTELDLIDTTARSARVCAAVGKAQAAARRRLSKKVLGLLSGDARGRFTTRGRYSAATVRGTIWSVSDRCDGTLTRVTRGVVAVRDFRRRKTITIRPGKFYLARAPGG